MDALLELDATAQAELIRKKEISASELLEAAIERIEKLNPELNAVVHRLYDEAREAVKAGLPSGPFQGVPIMMKDLGALVKGAPWEAGSRLMKGYVPDHDSELTARLRAAGFVILGKTNTPEFGILPTTEPEANGATCNPWNPEHTAGGSSGGAGAAVASGMVPVAHGGDGGGSIRIPASCCGVFGLKPTRARVSLAPDLGDVNSGLVCEHVLSHSVRDSAAILDLLAGPVAGDPYAAPAQLRPFAQDAASAPRRLRIAFTKQSASEVPVHADCQRAIEEAAALCAELGHDVEEAEPQINADEFQMAFTNIWCAGAAATIDSFIGLMGEAHPEQKLETLSLAMREAGRGVSGPDYILAVRAMHRMARQVAAHFETYDIWLTPTLAEPPPRLGEFHSPAEAPMMGMLRSAQFVPFTPICNATGQPAMSVPLFWNTEGLPIGSHFIGRFGDEATLFQLAAQLERARPWPRLAERLVGAS